MTPAPLNGRLAPARTARVLGLGHRLPDRVVPNGPIAEQIGVDADWIVRRTGISSRRHAAPDERTADLALAAARRALSDAGLRAVGHRPRAGRDDDRRRDHAEHGAARRRRARHRRRRVRRRRRVHRLAVGAVRRRRPDRDGPRRARARDRGGDDLADRRPDRQAHRRPVRRRRRRGRARPRGRRRDRPDPARLRRRHGRRDHRPPRRAHDRDGRPHDVQHGRQGPRRVDAADPRAQPD